MNEPVHVSTPPLIEGEYDEIFPRAELTEEAKQRLTFVNSLRALADFYETAVDLPIPSDHVIAIYSFGEEESKHLVARIAKILRTYKKDYSTTFFDLYKFFGVIKLRFVFYRNNVCERRVVGTKTVIKRELPAGVQYVDRQVQEDIIEWDCPILGDVQAKPLPASEPSSIAPPPDDEPRF